MEIRVCLLSYRGGEQQIRSPHLIGWWSLPVSGNFHRSLHSRVPSYWVCTKYRVKYHWFRWWRPLYSVLERLDNKFSCVNSASVSSIALTCFPLATQASLVYTVIFNQFPYGFSQTFCFYYFLGGLACHQPSKSCPLNSNLITSN